MAEITHPPDQDAAAIVENYRRAVERGDDGRAKRLRKSWAAWQGEDGLHEMAFGEPTDDEQTG